MALGYRADSILRDIVCNEIPRVLRDGRPYAICSFIGCWVDLLLQKVSAPTDFALWSSALLIFVLRYFSWRRNVFLGD